MSCWLVLPLQPPAPAPFALSTFSFSIFINVCKHCWYNCKSVLSSLIIGRDHLAALASNSLSYMYAIYCVCNVVMCVRDVLLVSSPPALAPFALSPLCLRAASEAEAEAGGLRVRIRRGHVPASARPHLQRATLLQRRDTLRSAIGNR